MSELLNRQLATCNEDATTRNNASIAPGSRPVHHFRHYAVAANSTGGPFAPAATTPGAGAAGIEARFEFSGGWGPVCPVSAVATIAAVTPNSSGCAIPPGLPGSPLPPRHDTRAVLGGPADHSRRSFHLRCRPLG